MSNQKNNSKKTVRKTDNKQNSEKNTNKSNEQKRNFVIISCICSIILLVLVLVIILFFNTKGKSESRNIMKKFNEAYESNELNIMFYHDSTVTDSQVDSIESRYLIDFSKEFKIDYIDIDISKISEKNRKNIETKLGLQGTIPSIVVTKDKKVVAIQEGFIESHNLVDLLKDIEMLDENANYSKISNFEFIDYEKYKKILKKDKVNVLIVGRAACEYCMSSKPILNNISKAYKKKFYYLDLSDLETENAKKFLENIQKNGYESESLKNDGIFNTPTILLMKDGKILSSLEGAKTSEEYIEYLKENKAIE